MTQGTAILIGLVVLAVVVVIVSATLVRGRKQVWKRFARRNGLVFESDGARAAVHGTIGRRHMRLHTSQDTSDAGLMGVQEVRMSIGLGPATPPLLFVSRAEGVVGSVRKASDAERVTTGDDTFDAKTLVEGKPAEAVRAYLTPHRRRVLEEFLAATDADDAGIAEGALFVEDREMLSDEPRLQERLDLMLEVATQLDHVSEQQDTETRPHTHHA